MCIILKCCRFAELSEDKARGPPWTVEEARDLPKWFKEHQYLSSEEIERQYYRFSGKDRSYLALQSKLYHQGSGYLCNKRKRSALQHHTPSKPSPLALTPSETKTLADAPQLSLSMSLISGSCSLTRQQTPGPIVPEGSVELDSLSRQVPRRSGSILRGRETQEPPTGKKARNAFNFFPTPTE